MPLPAALAERLAQRGLCVPAPPPPKLVEPDRKRDLKGVIACPNKSNVYHDCTHWCEVHWKPSNVPDAKYIQNVGKLLQKYPLPLSWTEIFDRGVNRYYYWDMETDFVSWLPPRHPKAKPSKSVAKKREKRLKRSRDDKNYNKHEEHKEKRRSKAIRKSHVHRVSERRIKHEDRKTRKKSKRNYIDPMDPAAYSNIPIGTWSDGLDYKKVESADIQPATKLKKNVSFGINSQS